MGRVWKHIHHPGDAQFITMLVHQNAGIAREGNTIVLALRTPFEPARGELARRAEVVRERWGLPAHKWLRVLKPVE